MTQKVEQRMNQTVEESRVVGEEMLDAHDLVHAVVKSPHTLPHHKRIDSCCSKMKKEGNQWQREKTIHFSPVSFVLSECPTLLQMHDDEMKWRRDSQEHIEGRMMMHDQQWQARRKTQRRRGKEELDEIDDCQPCSETRKCHNRWGTLMQLSCCHLIRSRYQNLNSAQSFDASHMVVCGWVWDGLPWSWLLVFLIICESENLSINCNTPQVSPKIHDWTNTTAKNKTAR